MYLLCHENAVTIGQMDRDLVHAILADDTEKFIRRHHPNNDHDTMFAVRESNEYGNIIALLILRRLNDVESYEKCIQDWIPVQKTTIVEFFGVHEKYRGKNIFEKHFAPIITEYHRRYLYHPTTELPLYARARRCDREMIAKLDTLFVPLTTFTNDSDAYVFFGPPLGVSRHTRPTRMFQTHDCTPQSPNPPPLSAIHSEELCGEHVERIRRASEKLIMSDECLQNLEQCMGHVIDLFNDRCIPYMACCGTALGLRRYGKPLPWDDDLDFAVHRATYLFLRNEIPAELSTFWWRRYRLAFRDHFRYPKAKWLLCHTDEHLHCDIFCAYYDAESDAFLCQSWENNPRTHFVHCCTFEQLVNKETIIAVGGRHAMIPSQLDKVLDKCYSNWRTRIVVEHPHTGQSAMAFPTDLSQSRVLVPLEGDTYAWASLDTAFYDDATMREKGICFMLRAKNEERTIENSICSLHEKLDGKIAFNIVFIDNGSTDRTLEIARQHLKASDLCVSYPAQVAKAGLETYVTSCDSVHSLPWFYQFCLFQCTRYSHVFKWDADFRLSDKLAARLITEFCNENTEPADRYEIGALFEDNVVRYESYILSVRSRYRYFRYHLWESWWSLAERSRKRLDARDVIEHDSKLDAPKSYFKIGPWWENESEKVQEMEHAVQAKRDYEDWRDNKLEQGRQLFCRSADPACDYIMHALPQNKGHISGIPED